MKSNSKFISKSHRDGKSNFIRQFQLNKAQPREEVGYFFFLVGKQPLRSHTTEHTLNMSSKWNLFEII